MHIAMWIRHCQVSQKGELLSYTVTVPAVYSREYTSVVISAHSGPITKMAQLSQACMCCTSFHFFKSQGSEFLFGTNLSFTSKNTRKKEKAFF